MSEEAAGENSFQIFRANKSKDIVESQCMAMAPISPEVAEGIASLVRAGYSDGEEIKVLCNLPGFSLVYSWFKPGFPLPLHSHDADCLYYVISGSLRLGTEELGPRDSFFVPCDVPYTYKVGNDGLEILEFRHKTKFNFKPLAKSSVFWSKALNTVTERRPEWQKAKRPALNAD